MKICLYISSILIFFIPSQKFCCFFRFNWLREILFASFGIFILSVIYCFAIRNVCNFFYKFFIRVVILVCVEGYFVFYCFPLSINICIMGWHCFDFFCCVRNTKGWVFIPTLKNLLRIIWISCFPNFIIKTKISYWSFIFVWFASYFFTSWIVIDIVWFSNIE